MSKLIRAIYYPLMLTCLSAFDHDLSYENIEFDDSMNFIHSPKYLLENKDGDKTSEDTAINQLPSNNHKRIFSEEPSHLIHFDTPKKNSSGWSLSFNKLDMEIGHNFCFGKKILLHSLMSFQAVAIDHEVNISYDFHSDMKNGMIPNAISLVTKKEFKGVGVRLGANALWHFTKHFNFFSKLHGSLVEGKFFVHKKDDALTAFQTPLSIASSEGINAPWKLRANIEGGLGFVWETFFNKGKHRLALNLGYEVRQWFDKYQLTDLVIPMNDHRNIIVEERQVINNLSTQSLTVQINYNF